MNYVGNYVNMILVKYTFFSEFNIPCLYRRGGEPPASGPYTGRETIRYGPRGIL